MSHDFAHDDDPAATTVFLAAEAAVLTERVRMLRQQLADVDARIRETAEKLGRLDPPPPASAEEHETSGTSATARTRQCHH
ncbi:hypothetical protein J8N05_19765 [Streptomyces sp. BH-SS-21]|uniref:Uncharacterized protein n=1 Tax=Streptomyces liliiviolaceus TaxID=2823109 RepID=A0A940XUJ0_9ACTN|nr:hypothetical protein [Streptomyces liliiviolaceus]MBQ0850426.1 hypothetical protein [Streptomyces liliiviolaceus]